MPVVSDRHVMLTVGAWRVQIEFVDVTICEEAVSNLQL